MTYAVAMKEYTFMRLWLPSEKKTVHTMRVRCDMDGDHGDVDNAKIGRPIDLNNTDQLGVRE